MGGILNIGQPKATLPDTIPSEDHALILAKLEEMDCHSHAAMALDATFRKRGAVLDIILSDDRVDAAYRLDDGVFILAAMRAGYDVNERRIVPIKKPILDAKAFMRK